MYHVLINTCLGAIFIFITAASPNRASLGATNGLSQVRLEFHSYGNDFHIRFR
jgi:hypothetical protein